jgi:hypothetical protein
VATPPAAGTAAEALAGPVCLGAGGWRIASLESWRGQRVRVWRAIEPISDVSGPLDPSIPSSPSIASEVEALGFCAPAFGPDKPVGPAAIAAWWLVGGEAEPLQLRQVRPEHGLTPIAALYQPLGRCGLGVPCPSFFTRQVPQTWVSGRVVFRYADTGRAITLWFAVDLEVTPNDAGTASPGPSGG